MKKRLSAGFILGFIGGFINVLFALLAAYDLTAGMHDPETSVILFGPFIISVILIILLLLNFTGACICRNKLAAGRALMYVTGLILLILLINGLSDAFGIASQHNPSELPASFIIFYAVIIAAQILSITAAALLSVPAGKEQAPEYGGVFDVYRYTDKPKETLQQELKAVHRLYNLPVEILEPDLIQTTETKSVDTE